LAAKIIDGKAIAEGIRSRLAVEVGEFRDTHAVTPHLAAVLVGDDPASQVYVRSKSRACEQAGIKGTAHRLSAETSQSALLELVDQLNCDAEVHGILVQLPLPPAINEQAVLDAINPIKDVDGFHPDNVGRLVQGRPRFLPCTPHGCQRLLVETGVPIAGAHVVVVGRSEIVGKPLASMLMQKGEAGDATVTVCHSRTRDLPSFTRQADILVAAIGRAEFVTADMVKPGATVIDVGINRLPDGRLVGDVDFAAVAEVAGAITPVPKGVGPMTIAMLLQNTLLAARLQTSPES